MEWRTTGILLIRSGRLGTDVEENTKAYSLINDTGKVRASAVETTLNVIYIALNT